MSRRRWSELTGGLGIAIALVQLAIGDHTARVTALVIGVVLIIAAIVMWRQDRNPQLRTDAEPIQVSFQVATDADIAWIARLEARKFHSDAVPEETLREWHTVNPNGFLILSDRGKRIGHIDILAVRDDIFATFIAGRITERGIAGSGLLRPNEREKARDLYVESFIVLGDTKEIHTAAVGSCLANLDLMFAHIADPATIRYVYGLAATRAGEEFMKKWGFEQVTPADRREDGHPLYRKLYSALKVNLSTAPN